MIELDDDDQPMEAGEKFKSEPERARYWLDVNHAPLTKVVSFDKMDEDQFRRFMEGYR